MEYGLQVLNSLPSTILIQYCIYSDECHSNKCRDAGTTGEPHSLNNVGAPQGHSEGGGGAKGQFAPGPRLKRGPKMKIRRHPMHEIRMF